MHVGTAAIDFTPQPGLVLQGHLSENRSHGVLWPLEARAAFFRSGNECLCIITLDVIGVDLATATRIRSAVASRIGITPARVVVAASHTHCAPAMLKNLAMTPDPAFVASVESAAIACAEQAARVLVPFKLGLGCGAAHFNVNRRPLPGETQFNVNFAGVVDHRARLVRIDGPDDKPLLILFTFSCHPTTKPGSEGWISPDYPGVARSRIESALNCRAMFLPGCFGNIRPHIDGKFAAATKEQLESIGDALGDSVVRAVSPVRPTVSPTLAVRESQLLLQFAQPKSLDELAQMVKDDSTPGARVRANWAKRTMQRISTSDIPPGISSVMQAIHLGPLAIVTIPGEPVQEIGYALERALLCREGEAPAEPRLTQTPGSAGASPSQSARADDLWPIGYSNDQIGYLVTERHKAEGGYEPNAYTFYDRPAAYRDEEQTIVDTAARLFDNLNQ